jgi:Zn-dependent protease with chaperone function
VSTGGTPPPARSLAGRALLAAALFVGFYLLALVIAGALILIPFVEYRSVGTMHVQLALLCWFGATVILVSVAPRREPFKPPGPRLDPAVEPRLFAELTSVAEATGQRMPESVYAVLDVNAAVWQHGGVLGVRAKRAMVIGVPLLAAVSVPQFRAVVAHEFGHYHHGDTRLGPWIYGTRTAVIRTIVTLSEHGRTIIRLPFLWYGTLFLRTTLAVSRKQEFAADVLAASVTSAKDVRAGLRESHRASMAFGVYMDADYLPLLDGGYRLPLAEGFARFLSAAQVREATDTVMGEELRTATTDPFDSHPSLSERLEALAIEERRPGKSEPAVSLLADIDGTELRLIRQMNPEWAESAALVAWDSVGSGAWPSIWERDLSERRSLVTSFSVGGLADLPNRLAELGEGRASAREREEATVEAVRALGAALALALRRVGWIVSAGPGDAVVCTRAGDTIEPFKVVTELGDGTMAPDDWRRRCGELGISDVPLADPSWPPEAPEAPQAPEPAEAPSREMEPPLPDRPDQAK